MKVFQKQLTKFMVLVVALVFCGLPEAVQAQQAQDPQQQQQTGTTVDPSKGPLQPVPAQNQPSTEPAPQNPESSTTALPATPAREGPAAAR